MSIEITNSREKLKLELKKMVEQRKKANNEKSENPANNQLSENVEEIMVEDDSSSELSDDTDSKSKVIRITLDQVDSVSSPL